MTELRGEAKGDLSSQSSRTKPSSSSKAEKPLQFYSFLRVDFYLETMTLSVLLVKPLKLAVKIGREMYVNRHDRRKNDWSIVDISRARMSYAKSFAEKNIVEYNREYHLFYRIPFLTEFTLALTPTCVGGSEKRRRIRRREGKGKKISSEREDKLGPGRYRGS
ncbi:hypothetical protein V1478_016345 [Vespula squamosa]|uniref:Uncharacterized protein n=1 Tax=Vespula squamosa TaxID=30214 RepID=A0ABD1ZZK7_VESSQ